MDPGWFADAAAVDLRARTELQLCTVGTALEGKVNVVLEPLRLISSRDFDEGDLILAELAIASVPEDALSTTSFAHSCRLNGPFASLSGRSAAVRFAASLPGPKEALTRDTALARSDVLRMALASHGLSASLRVSSDDKDASKDSTCEKPLPQLRRPERFLFVRASALRHSCDPAAVAVIYRDSAAGGIPALHLLARRRITNGEEITVCRLPDATHSREMRSAALAKLTAFPRSGAPSTGPDAAAPCACTRCTNDFDDTEAVRCRLCNGVSRICWPGAAGTKGRLVSAGGAGAAAAPVTALKEASREGGSEAAGEAGEPCVRCESCGATDPEPLDSLRKRVAALAAMDAAIAASGRAWSETSGPQPEDALRIALAAYAVVHPRDTHLLRRAHLLLHRVVDGRSVMAAAARSGRPGGSDDRSDHPDVAASSEPSSSASPGASPAEVGEVATGPLPAPAGVPSSPSLRPAVAAVPAAAVDLSDALVSAACALPFLDPFLLREILIDHGLLCGMAGCGERGRDAWRQAAALTRRYNPIGSPMHELFESFVAKPPRNAREAAAAFRMRAVAEQTLGI